jgi:hypothetical protein
MAPSTSVEGLQVRLNGKPLDTMALGSPAPVDPGEYTIEAAASGKKAWSTRIVIEAKPGLTTVRE